MRVASFDREAIATTMRNINRLGGIPTPEDLAETEKAFFTLLQRPEAKARIKTFLSKGCSSPAILA